MNHHVIILNLPASPCEELPDPSKSPVTIDGIGFDHVSNVALKCDGGEPTEVSITFFATVEGKVHARETWKMPSSVLAETRNEPVADFTQSFNARDWAQAFVELVRRKPEIATDEGTMIAWFANAIMRGLDEARNRAKESEPDLDSDGDVASAQEYLLNRPGAVSGQQGDHHTHGTLTHLWSHGISAPMCMKLVTTPSADGKSWNDRCLPSWTAEELAWKTHQVYSVDSNIEENVKVLIDSVWKGDSEFPRLSNSLEADTITIPDRDLSSLEAAYANKWPTETTPPGRGHRPPTEYRTVIAGIDTLLGDAIVDNQENANAHRLEQLPAPCVSVFPTRTTPPGRGQRPPTINRPILVAFSSVQGERLTAEGRGDGAIDSVNDPMAFVRTYGVMPPHLDRPDAELSEGGINQRDACAHEIELHRQRVTADIEDMTRGIEVSDMGVVRRQASERVAAAGIFPVSDNIPFAKDGPAIVYSRDAVVEARRKETLAATRARKPT